MGFVHKSASLAERGNRNAWKEGRKEGRKKDQYFFFSPPFCNSWENVGDETSCKCCAVYDCLALRYVRSTSQSITFIQTESQVCLMNFLELELDTACSLVLSVYS